MAVSQEFQFCSVCRRNHNLGRKHIYSKKHVNNVQNILHNFGKKIDEARRSMNAPSVIDGELEPGAQFWCHFCGMKVKKHISDGNMSIQFGGVFEHLASDDHKKSTNSWWTENGADKTKRSKFLLTQYDLNKFHNTVEEKLTGDKKEVEHIYDESVLIIKEREKIQKQVAEQPPVPYVPPPTVYHTVRNHLGIVQNPTGSHEGQRVWGGGIVKYKNGSDQWFPWEFDLDDGKKITGSGSHSFSSTLIKLGNSNTVMDREANIHTGATPPWLMADEDTDSPIIIGPSLTDFQKHVERTKKLGKNPNRVGANFDGKTEVSGEWSFQTLASLTFLLMTFTDGLPSFGGVWNAGPRWQTRKPITKRVHIRRDLRSRKKGRDKS